MAQDLLNLLSVFEPLQNLQKTKIEKGSELLPSVDFLRGKTLSRPRSASGHHYPTCEPNCSNK
jgi:hypothetical protein